MSEETRRRVFEPFFTTKVDIGRGLGLSSAFGTITRHGGSTHVESELGRGATFTAELPISDSALEITAQPAPLPTATSLRILLVETMI